MAKREARREIEDGFEGLQVIRNTPPSWTLYKKCPFM